MAAEVRLLPPRVPKRVTSAPARCEGQQYPLRKSDGTLRGLNTNLGDLLPWLRKMARLLPGDDEMAFLPRRWSDFLRLMVEQYERENALFVAPSLGQMSQ